MAAPALRIPLGLNMAEFEKSVETAKGHTRQATQFILKQFVDMNAALGGPAAAGLAAGYGAAALRLVGIFGLVVGAAKLTGDAIQATRDRLVEMVDVADKAKSGGVSVEFFQSFISGAKGAQDRIEKFESALARAFQATKETFNPEFSLWNDDLDKSTLKISVIEKAMRDTRELFTTDQNFSGFDLFKNATTQDQKIKAVLLYMQQLKSIGYDLAALDIGEKMFGAKFTDDVRLGKESFDKMLRTIDSGSKANFISNEAAKNAKDLDDRLNDAYHTISERLKPDWDDLAGIALRIKGTWTSIIEAVANYKAAEVKGKPLEGSGTTSDAAARNNPDPESAAFGNPVILNQGRRRRGQAPDISPAPKAPSEAEALDAYSRLNDLSGTQPEPDKIPFPRRRPFEAPKPPEKTVAQRDPFEVSVDQIEKRIAALKAETATIDAGTAAQERAKTVALLEEAAKRANTAAGLKNKDVTAAQRIEIEKEADAMARAAAEGEKARIASSIRFNKNTSLLSPEDAAIAAQLKGLYPDVATALDSVEASAIRTNTALKTTGDAFSNSLSGPLVDYEMGVKSAGDATKAFEQQFVRSMLTMTNQMLIMGPIAKGLQALFSGGFNLASFGFNPIAGVTGSIGHNAAGTDNWSGGPTWVGEKGPEIVNLPRGAQVIPNAVASKAGGSSTSISYHIDAAGADSGTVARIYSVLQAHAKTIQGQGRAMAGAQSLQATGVGR